MKESFKINLLQLKIAIWLPICFCLEIVSKVISLFCRFYHEFNCFVFFLSVKLGPILTWLEICFQSCSFLLYILPSVKLFCFLSISQTIGPILTYWFCFQSYFFVLYFFLHQLTVLFSHYHSI